MATKLRYFNGYGRGDVLRLLLTTSNIPFEDIVYLEDWYQVKDSGNFPLKQLPTLEYDGKTLNQTRAIASYLCGKSGWLPLTPDDAYLDNWYWDSLEDLFPKFYMDFIYGASEDAKEKAKEKLKKEIFPLYMSNFEKNFTQFGGHESGQLVGKTLTPSMFYMVSMMNIICHDGGREVDFLPILQKEAPKVSALIESKKKGDFALFYGKMRKEYAYPF